MLETPNTTMQVTLVILNFYLPQRSFFNYVFQRGIYYIERGISEHGEDSLTSEDSGLSFRNRDATTAASVGLPLSRWQSTTYLLYEDST